MTRLSGRFNHLSTLMVFGLIASVLATVPLIQTPAVAALPSGFSDELVTSAGITQATGVIPFSNGRVLVAERNGSIELVDPTGPSVTKSEYLDVNDLQLDGEKGLLNMVLDPDFDVNQYSYIYYHNSVTDRARVSRFTGLGDFASAASETIIWEDPLIASDQIVAEHWGGGLSFGPDGFLYLALGDKKDEPNDAQDLTLSAGKLLRLDPEGADLVGPWVTGQHNPHMIPGDNPFIDGPGGNLDEIWALGLRNPFRAKWDIPGNRLFISEVGGNQQMGPDASHEDLHMVTPADIGANFGWPACEGPDCDGPPPADYSPPVFSIQHPDSRAMMLGPVYRGSSFPISYNGAVFLFDFVEGWLRYVFVDANGQLDPSVPAGGIVFADPDDLDKPLDMAVGDDGELWYVGSGELHRIVVNSNNLPPVITEASATPLLSPSSPVDVQFTATANDPENQALTYLWEFGDGNTSTDEDPLHTYAANGSYTAILNVSDSSSNTVSPELLIEVGSPPTVTIEEPNDGLVFQAGQQIVARATGTDDGSFSAADFVWNIGLFHDNHIHPVRTDEPGTPCLPAGSSCITLQVPDTGHDFTGTTRFDFDVTLTDSDGLSRTDSITTLPDKVDLTFDVDAAGGEGSLLVDQIPRSTPAVLDTLIGFRHTIDASDPLISGGRLYQFDDWSTGETTTELNVVVPNANASFVAHYTDLGQLPRATAGLEVLYTFDEGSGATVGDTSGTGTPLDLTVADPGAVTWGASNLVVNSSTVISSPGAAADLNAAITASNELTVEAWVAPENLTQSGPARMVSVSPSGTRRNVTLGQGDSGSTQGDRYSTRLRTTETSKNGTPSVNTPSGTASTALTHVLYTRDTAGTVTFYIDGVEEQTAAVTGDTSGWDANYPLHLANEADGSRPWLGTLELVAIYNRALTPAEVTQNFTAGPGGSPAVGNPPVALDDDVATDEDTPIAGGDVLADNGNGPDSDPDTDPITVTAVNGSGADVGSPITLASGASLTLNANGSFDYDPAGAFDFLADAETTTDTFIYTIGDGNGNSDSAAVTVTITGTNDAPTLDPVADPSVLEDATLDIPLTASDPEGDGLTLALAAGGPTFITLIDNTDGTATLSIAPTAGDAGVYPITINTTDDGTPNQLTTTNITVTVTAPVGGPPVAVDDDVTTDEDTALIGDVLADNGNGPDADPDTDPLTVTAVNGSGADVGNQITLASGASLTLNANGSFDYDPSAAFENLADAATTTDSFTYTIGDGTGNFDTAAVTVTITGINDAPALDPVTDPSVLEDATFDVALNASDPEGDALTLTLAAGNPAFISLTDNTDGTGTLSIAPTAGDAGVYPITINTTDDGTPNQLTPTNLTVTITEPSARATTGLEVLYTFDEGSGTTVTDTSGTGTALNLTVADPGAVTWGSGNLAVNTPTVISSSGAAADLNAAIAASNELTVEAWITPDNLTQTGPARMVSVSSSGNRRNVTLGQGDSGSATGDRYSTRLRTTDTSKNGTPSIATPAGTATVALTHVLYTRNAAGTATFYVDGVLQETEAITGDTSGWDANYPLHLANEANSSRPWLGTLELVAIYNRALTPAEVTQNFTAGPGGSPAIGSPPVAADDDVATDEDTALIGGDVLADNGNGLDSDPDTDPLTVTEVNGSGPDVGSPITLASGASLTLNANGSFDYDPAGAFDFLAGTATATDTFIYTIGDGNGNSDTAAATVTITGINDAPTVDLVPDPNMLEGTTLDLAINANDPEGDALTLTLDVTSPPFITLIDNTDGTGTLSIAPTAGDAGIYPITIITADNGTPNLATDTSVIVTVTAPVGGPPVAVDDDVTTDEDTALIGGDVLADNGNGLDSDPDTDPLTVTAVNGSGPDVGSPITLASGASLTLNANGSFDYDPAGAFENLADAETATDTFTYTIGDGTGSVDTATVTVTITGINDAPTLNPVADPSVLEDAALDIPLAASDPEGDGLALALAPGNPAFITITDNTDGTGTLSIAPTAGDAGVYPITINTTDDGTPNQLTPTNLTVTITEPSARATTGLEVLYTFDEGSGTTVTDTSGTGTALNLTVADPGAVTWGSGNLAVNTPTVISSSGAAADLNAAIAASNELTVEAWITPDNLTQTGPARMVSVSSSGNRRNVTLGQGDSGSATGDRYSTRLRTTDTSKNGTPSVRTAGGTATLTLTHVMYTRDTVGTVNFYIDGVLQETDTVAGDTSGWDADYPLHLANEANSSRPWLGTLELVAIYNRALTPAEVTQNFTAGPG